MRLTGRRESNNVEDRRGMGTGAKAGIGGIGGIIIIALFIFLSGGNLGDFVNNVVQTQMQGNNTNSQKKRRNLLTSQNRFLLVLKMSGQSSFSFTV